MRARTAPSILVAIIVVMVMAPITSAYPRSATAGLSWSGAAISMTKGQPSRGSESIFIGDGSEDVNLSFVSGKSRFSLVQRSGASWHLNTWRQDVRLGPQFGLGKLTEIAVAGPQYLGFGRNFSRRKAAGIYDAYLADHGFVGCYFDSIRNNAQIGSLENLCLRRLFRRNISHASGGIEQSGSINGEREGKEREEYVGNFYGRKEIIKPIGLLLWGLIAIPSSIFFMYRGLCNRAAGCGWRGYFFLLLGYGLACSATIGMLFGWAWL